MGMGDELDRSVEQQQGVKTGTRTPRQKDTFDTRGIPNGAILVLSVRYQNNPKVYTYAALKGGGLWFLSGTGQVPQAAGWGAVERWLARDGRELVSIDAVSDRTQIWPSVDTSPVSR